MLLLSSDFIPAGIPTTKLYFWAGWGIRILLLTVITLAAAQSGLSAWTIWTLRQGIGANLQNGIDPQRQALARAKALRLPTAPAWIRLADRDPAREKDHLLAALQDDPRSSDALVRLALLAEIEGDRSQAASWYTRATAVDRRYPIFLAAAGFAGRAGEERLLASWAQLALQYRPHDLFNLFAILCALPTSNTVGAKTAGLATAEKIVLQLASLSQQTEFLYFLIGQEQYFRAFEFQNHLTASDPRIEAARLELAERLLLGGDPDKAWILWTKLEPKAQPGALQNGDFLSKPTSLAFDWRLTHNPKAHFDARPGVLSLNLEELAAPLELMSQLVYAPGFEGPARWEVNWQGAVEGLQWNWEDVPHKPGLQRMSLVALPGQARRLSISGLRLTSWKAKKQIQ